VPRCAGHQTFIAWLVCVVTFGSAGRQDQEGTGREELCGDGCVVLSPFFPFTARRISCPCYVVPATHMKRNLVSLHCIQGARPALCEAPRSRHMREYYLRCLVESLLADRLREAATPGGKEGRRGGRGTSGSTPPSGRGIVGVRFDRFCFVPPIGVSGVPHSPQPGHVR